MVAEKLMKHMILNDNIMKRLATPMPTITGRC